eukprot:271587_1
MPYASRLIFTLLFIYHNIEIKISISIFFMFCSLSPYSSIIQFTVILFYNKFKTNSTHLDSLKIAFISYNIFLFMIHITIFWKHIFIKEHNPWFGFINAEIFELPIINDHIQQTYIILYNITFIMSALCTAYWIHQQSTHTLTTSAQICLQKRNTLLEQNNSYFENIFDFIEKKLLILMMIIIVVVNYIASAGKVLNPSSVAHVYSEYIAMTLFYCILICLLLILMNYLLNIVNSLLFSVIIIAFYMDDTRHYEHFPDTLKPILNFVYNASNDKDRLLRILTINLTYYFKGGGNDELYRKINKFGIYNIKYMQLDAIPIKKRNRS